MQWQYFIRSRGYSTPQTIDIKGKNNMKEVLKNVSSNDQPCSATFDLVGHILSETVFNAEEGVVLKAEKNKFYYDPDSGIQLGGFVSLKIRDVEISATFRGTTLTLNGMLETKVIDSNHFFSLFYFIERVRGENIGLECKSTEVINKYIPNCLFNPSAFLYDALFQISVSRINSQGTFHRVGVGKGFLIMNQKEGGNGGK